MSSTSRLGLQFQQVLAALDAAAVPVALIGGLALASHKVVRATQDIDFLADIDCADAIERVFESLGYRCAYRSDDAANYLRADERVDLIYARRPIARRLLATASRVQTSLGQVPVVSCEGLIGLKLQALVNDPRRTQDLADIRALLRVGTSALRLDEVREYFVLFGREALLDELLRDVNASEYR